MYRAQCNELADALQTDFPTTLGSSSFNGPPSGLSVRAVGRRAAPLGLELQFRFRPSTSPWESRGIDWAEEAGEPGTAPPVGLGVQSGLLEWY